MFYFLYVVSCYESKSLDICHMRNELVRIRDWIYKSEADSLVLYRLLSLTHPLVALSVWFPLLIKWHEMMKDLIVAADQTQFLQHHSTLLNTWPLSCFLEGWITRTIACLLFLICLTTCLMNSHYLLQQCLRFTLSFDFESFEQLSTCGLS